MRLSGHLAGAIEARSVSAKSFGALVIGVKNNSVWAKILRVLVIVATPSEFQSVLKKRLDSTSDIGTLSETWPITESATPSKV
jgi:hypothetical protein